MSKIKVFVAAVLVSIPMLTLDAAQVPASQSTAFVTSDSKPTTANGLCFWWNTGTQWIWICIG